MKDTLTIPATLNVGFQNRKDTYTGKLAYVVYTDKQGKLRKEASWKSWCDQKITKLEIPNEPISGFVLNRQVGGARSGSHSWDTRIEKVRVYDPRDFEFEISIPNLLFILQECSAIKGKGLEGEFVYSWNGTELILLPVSSQEYTNSVAFGKLQDEKVSKDQMVIGCSYYTKNKQEVVYMGQHPWWGIPSTWGNTKNGRKRHVFAFLGEKMDYSNPISYLLDDGFTKLAKKTSDSPVPVYPRLYELLAKSCLISKPSKLTLVPCKVRETPNSGYYLSAAIEVPDGIIAVGEFRQDYPAGGFYRPASTPRDPNYQFTGRQRLFLKNGRLMSEPFAYTRPLTLEMAKTVCKSVIVECENGAKSTTLNCTI